MLADGSSGAAGFVCRPGLKDLGDKLVELCAFTGAQVEEADADGAAVMNGLGDAGEAQGQTLETKLDFDAAKDTEGKRGVGAEAASAGAEVGDAAGQVDAGGDEVEDGAGVDGLARFFAAIGC